jgi:hypothetical protein
VEDVGLAIADEPVLQGQLGGVGRVATLPGNILQLRGDGVIDP